ncbi:MAG TPA: metallophosphoesterase [Blastocatellia bacterium]|nr:metallophosphoesterase [Blastocatellia bacterium]
MTGLIPRSLCLLLTAFLLFAPALAQTPATAPAQADEPVRAITPPAKPLPPEEASAGVTKFSFIVYGDTRGRRDGFELQYEHSLIVTSALARIKALEKTQYPVRFVLQSGDAVVNGRIARQLNVSFVDLINRLTTEGGVPWFLAPGNHDVSSSSRLDDPERVQGVKNFLAMNEKLIPPDGSPRRLAGYPVYAFGYGNAFVIAMDSQIANDDKQFEWVKGQLEGLDRQRYQHVFVFCHHPAFSSGPHGARPEPQTAELRARWMPLFRKHHVRALFTGHEHFFEHWVERYQDAGGKKYRLDHILTGGGGAPLYDYRGDPDTVSYTKASAAEKITLERLSKPAAEPGGNAYHYLVVKVDGDRISLEVVGVDWGRDYQPYRSNKAKLADDEDPRP